MQIKYFTAKDFLFPTPINYHTILVVHRDHTIKRKSKLSSAGASPSKCRCPLKCRFSKMQILCSLGIILFKSNDQISLCTLHSSKFLFNPLPTTISFSNFLLKFFCLPLYSCYEKLFYAKIRKKNFSKIYVNIRA